ncbi:hypothetical protein GCM10027578_40700 [Spirosoma luteolum]
MSKTLRYTLIAEGFAEYQFIPAYIDWIAKQIGDLQPVRTKIQLAISKNPSVSKVLQEAATYCVQSFADKKYPCDLFIAGIDLDTTDFTDNQEYHTQRLKQLQDAMGRAYKLYENKIILYAPIQAIDCWIHYVQQNATANSLESIPKVETKRKVYGQRQDRQQIEKIAREAAMKADFDELARQSRSFKHFHQQVVAFLEAYDKPPHP